MEGLLHAAWDRKMVRDFCALAKYIEGKKKADAMFEDIMSSPEKIQRTVAAYADFLREDRIAELESELASLKETLL